MTNSVSISYIFSSYVELTRTCHQSCGYCSFFREDGPLMPIADVKSKIDDLASRGATEVIFISGESPQDFPHIQIALHELGFASFADYLNEACRLALAANMLPVLETGYLDSFTLERFVNSGCSVRLNLVCASLSAPGEALEKSRGRNPSSGKACIESLHAAGIPYSLGYVIGIGEKEEDRLKFIKEIGNFCTADPLLQDIRLIPFQPTPGCSMPERPPLPFAAIQKAINCLREVFPVHHISIPPHLFHRFPELVESGLNDLGSVPVLTGDPTHSNFEIPCFETLKTRLEQKNVLLYERGTLTTPVALNRPEIYEALANGRRLTERRNLSGLNLVDNDHCFVCGPRNKNGLHIPVKKHIEGHTCSFTWAPGPAYQGYAGIVHGGILSTLLDEAMAYAVMGAKNEILAVTADMHIRYFRPAPVGVPLKFAATLVGQRKNLFFARGSVILPDGAVLA
ncbi:MAG: hotdog domain-containing protein, partial [Candidatus Riflebacteria bacterium]|nr:hotdog domain-containing protein [Candidatus Riflebacteria bacterium]